MPIMRGPVRARDLRANMREYGAQEGIVITLEQMLDEHVQDREHIRELAQMVDRILTHLNELQTVGGELAKRMSELKRAQQQGDAIDHGDNG